MNKKHLIIISCLLLIGLTAGLWQYIQIIKPEMVSAVTVGTPNPGHTWASMECNASSICIDTVANLVGIGTATPAAKLHVSAAALGVNLNDAVEMERLYSSNGNASYLDIRQIRTAAGGDWTFAGTRIQEKIDSTWMGYIQFNGTGNNGGISFGTGLTATAPGNVGEKMKIDLNGNVGIGIGAATPAAKLDVNGQMKVCDGTTCGILQLKCYTTGTPGCYAVYDPN